MKFWGWQGFLGIEDSIDLIITLIITIVLNFIKSKKLIRWFLDLPGSCLSGLLQLSGELALGRVGEYMKGVLRRSLAVGVMLVAIFLLGCGGGGKGGYQQEQD